MPNTKISSCLIDNWSLIHAARLIEENMNAIRMKFSSKVVREISDAISSGDISVSERIEYALEDTILDFHVFFGALSNLINAIVLFDEVYYPINKYERLWKDGYPEFASILSGIVRGVELDPLLRKAISDQNNDDTLGINTYKLIADYLGCDMLLNPIRSENLFKWFDDEEISYSNRTFNVLQRLDENITQIINSTKDKQLIKELSKGFRFPSVMAASIANNKKEITQKRDILECALNFRNRSKTKSFRTILRRTVEDKKPNIIYLKLLREATLISSELTHNKFYDWGSEFTFVFFPVPQPSLPLKQLLSIIPDYRLFLRTLTECRIESNRFRAGLDKIKW
jgi:hypothetical protein